MYNMLIILIVLIILYLSKHHILSEKKTSPNALYSWNKCGFGKDYDRKVALDYLKTLIKEYGTPDESDYNKGGYALWNNIGPFTKMMIKDETIPHNDPDKHIDFFYTYYPIDIPESKMFAIKLTDGIHYTKDGFLVVRCNHMIKNVVTTWLIKRYVNDEMTIDQFGYSYGPMVNELMNSKTGSKVKSLMEML